MLVPRGRRLERSASDSGGPASQHDGDITTTIRSAIAGIDVLAASIATMLATPVFSADDASGKMRFKGKGALSHTAERGDNGGAQGPSVTGIFGRNAASNPAFSYTTPLRNSGLTWDNATRDRFLASSTRLVPESVVAYLQSVEHVRRRRALA